MAEQKFQVIVIGGGHNGLVAAAYLAKAGRNVLLLERRPVLGGVGVTEEFYPGFRVDSLLHDGGLFRPGIIRDLFLRMYDFDFVAVEPLLANLQPDGRSLMVWGDSAKTAAEIGYFSAGDGQKFGDYVATMSRFATFLEAALGRVPPDLYHLRPADLISWLGVGTGFRGMGGKDMYGLLRLLPMSVYEWLTEWFESEAVQAALGLAGVMGLRQGPRSGGTALNLLYHSLGSRPGLPAVGLVRGGLGNLSRALAAAAGQFGATIRTNSQVSQIKVVDGRAVGVILSDGQEIAGDLVISTANPRHTFTELLDPMTLDPTFNRAVANIKFRGCMAKVNLALDGLPTFTALQGRPMPGRIQIAPSLDAIEQAYDAAKYGQFSTRPVLDMVIPSLHSPGFAPAGKHVLSILVQYAPYQLRGSNWETQRQALTQSVLDTLAEYAPNLRQQILHCQTLTPADLEEGFGLAEGASYHGELMLDQMLFMRPVPGWGQYRTPVDGLYMGGAGSHPGGGITGEPGRLVAKTILERNG